MSESTEGANQPEAIRGMESAMELVAELRGRLDPGGEEEELAGRIMNTLVRVMEQVRANQGGAASGGRRAGGPKTEEEDSHGQLQVHHASSPCHSVGSEESSRCGKRRKAVPERKTGHRRRSHPYSFREVTSATLDDGYTWRKYGQKDIQNSNSPRSYYRCTHRFTKGCQAIRQAQKREDNPLVYSITYFGDHTCKLTPSLLHQHQQPPPTRTEIINFSAEAVPSSASPAAPSRKTLVSSQLPVLKKEMVAPGSGKDKAGQLTPDIQRGCGSISQRDATSKPSAPAARSPGYFGSLMGEQGDTSSRESSCMSDVSCHELDYMDDTFYDLSSLFTMESHDFSSFLVS